MSPFALVIDRPLVGSSILWKSEALTVLLVIGISYSREVRESRTNSLPCAWVDASMVVADNESRIMYN